MSVILIPTRKLMITQKCLTFSIPQNSKRLPLILSNNINNAQNQ